MDDFIGVIKSEPDPPGIDQAKWIALIKEHASFTRPKPKEIINPFKRGERIKVYPPGSTAIAVVNKKLAA